MSGAGDRDAGEGCRGGKCPICGNATVTEFRPFCSRRCADIDLHRWLTGAYAIPATEDDDEDGPPRDEGG